MDNKNIDIAKIDKNFKFETTIDKEDVKFYDAEEVPMRLYGIYREGNGFVRMSTKVAEETSWGVGVLCHYSSGGRVRFRTDSPYVAIRAELGYFDAQNPCFSLQGKAGFDIYVRNCEKEIFAGVFRTSLEASNGCLERVHDFSGSLMRDITINFPLYCEVKKLYIGLAENAALLPHPDYKIEKPIVFYGSSITNGACASRAGMSYQGIISRELDANYINLGFSGCAKGEEPIREYMKNLSMSAFVLDYDHNAPSIEHLESTHLPIYKVIREVNPDLPIILASRPVYNLSRDEKARMEIIQKTYSYAKEQGDENIYFLSGPELMAIAKTDGTADGGHPNDLGFYSMAQAFLVPLREIFK